MQPHKSNWLTVAREQNLDGNAIFSLAKNGVLYIQGFSYDDGNTNNATNKSVTSNSGVPKASLPDDDLPAPPSCIAQSYRQKVAQMLKETTAVVKRLQVSLFIITLCVYNKRVFTAVIYRIIHEIMYAAYVRTYISA